MALWFVEELFLALYRRDHDRESAAVQVERLMLFLPLDGLPRPLSRENRVERAFADLWTGTAATVSPLWRDRFISGVRRFLDGVLWELEHVEAGMLVDERRHLGRVGPRRGKRRDRPQHVVGPLRPGMLLAQGHEFGPLVGGEPAIPLAGVRLGLPNPAAQGLGTHPEIDSPLLDLRSRFCSAVHPHRTLTQLERVLPGCSHGRCFSHENRLTLCHHLPHLVGTSTRLAWAGMRANKMN